MDTGLLTLGGLGVGLGLLMWIGARPSSREKTAAVAQKMMRDVCDWVCGVMAESGAWLRQDKVPDAVLIARVQARLNRLVSPPGAIEVASDRGRVTLRGVVLERERDTLLSSLASMRGVTDLVDELEVQERATTIMGVQDHATP